MQVHGWMIMHVKETMGVKEIAVNLWISQMSSGLVLLERREEGVEERETEEEISGNGGKEWC